MKHIKIIVGLCFGFYSLATLAEVGDGQECTAAEDAAAKIYDQIATAYNSGHEKEAITYSGSFWNIYEKNENCNFIEELAEILKYMGINKSSTTSPDAPYFEKVLRGCTSPCKAIIKSTGEVHQIGVKPPEDNNIN